MKKILCTLLALCMLISMAPMALAEGVSGTFEGESNGFHGPVKVSVTLEDGAITDVTVTEQAETYGVSDWSISEMPNRIVEHQSWNVDVTSGATFSAYAVKYAVKNAIEAAGAEGLDAEVHETAEDETLDTDASVLAGEAGDLACERYVLDKGKLQVEVLCNLDKVAPAGAVVMVSYPRIEGATGLPARVWAITE